MGMVEGGTRTTPPPPHGDQSVLVPPEQDLVDGSEDKVNNNKVQSIDASGKCKVQLREEVFPTTSENQPGMIKANMRKKINDYFVKRQRMVCDSSQEITQIRDQLPTDVTRVEIDHQQKVKPIPKLYKEVDETESFVHDSTKSADNTTEEGSLSCAECKKCNLKCKVQPEGSRKLWESAT